MRRSSQLMVSCAVAVVLVAGCGRGSQAASVTTLATGAASTTTAGRPAAATTGPAAPNATTSARPSASVAPTGTDQAAQALFARSRIAAKKITSLHVVGVQKAAGETVTLDLSFGRHGTAGSVTQHGYRFDIVIIGPKFYVRAPLSFLEAQFPGATLPATVGKFVGKYVLTSTASANAKSFRQVADRAAILGGVYTAHPNLTLGPAKKVRGVSCRSLVDPGKGTFYVRADNAWPVQIVSGGASSVRLDFTRLNQVPDPHAPPRAMTVTSQGQPI